VTRYVFSDSSQKWLEANRFSDEEIGELVQILNRIEVHAGKPDARVKLGENISQRVSTLVYLLDSITDVEDKPICFEASGMIEIPKEAKDHFDQDLELDELEQVVGKLKKVKFARRYSYPRRRGTMKDATEEIV